MGPADGEDLLAEVHHAVRLAAAGHARSDVGEPGAQDAERLVREGAPGVESPDEPLQAEHRQALVQDQRGDVGRRRAELDGRRRGAARQGDRRARRVLERRRDVPGLVAPRRGAHEHRDARLRELPDPRAEPPERRGAGWLADDADDARVGIGVERRERRLQHEPADLVGEVAPAHTDRVRDALTSSGDVAGDFLEPRARGRGDADPAPRHGVGEAERHAANDRGAAVGSHQEQASRARERLQLPLRREGHVVAEEHHVEPRAQRLQRLGPGVGAGHGDERQRGVGHRAEGRRERPRPWRARPGGRAVPGERRLGGGACGLGGRRPVGEDGDDEVGRPGRLAIRGEESRVAQERAILRRAHHRGRAYDTSHRLHVVRETHQRDGVLVEAPPDEIPRGHHRSGARAHLGGVMPYALIFR